MLRFMGVAKSQTRLSVAAGAAGHENHAQGHHRGNPAAEQDGQQEGDQRKPDPLQADARQDGFRMNKYVFQGFARDAQRDAEHNEGQHDTECKSGPSA